MRHLQMRHFCRLLTTAVTIAVPTIAYAQDRDRTQTNDVQSNTLDALLFEEIIITARRREERLVDAPLSMTAISGETLENLQLRDPTEFLALSPGVSVDLTGANGLNTNIIIRGIGTPANFVEPGNAVYIDDVYASGIRTLFPAFYDIQNVQVLKGPQAALYGRNTTGGAVIITTGQPTDQLEVNASAAYEMNDRLDLNATVNIPLAEILQVRATGWYLDQGGGYYRNEFLDLNRDRRKDVGGRLNVGIDPFDGGRLVLSAEYSDQFQTGFEGVVDGAQLGPDPDDIESRRNELRDDVAGIDIETYRLSGKFDVDTDIGEFVLVVGYRSLDINEPRSDFDGSIYQASLAEFAADPVGYLFSGPTIPGFISAEALSPSINSRVETNSATYAELRYGTRNLIDGVSFLGGVTYYKDEATFFDLRTLADEAVDVAQAIDASPLPLPPLNGSFERDILQDTESWAGFGQVIVLLRDSIEVTGEVRYTHDRKSIDFAQNSSGLYALFLPSNALVATRTFTNWSPGVTVAYKPSGQVNYYAKYVQGFRAGGNNTAVNNPALIPYDPEKAENYEIGFKGVAASGAFNYGIAGFLTKIDNTIVPVLDPGGLLNVSPLQNVAETKTYGIEADASFVFPNGFSLTGSFGVFSNELESNIATLENDEQPFVPSLTGSLVASYDTLLSSNMIGFLTVGYRHRSGGLIGDGDIEYDDFNIVGVNIGIRINDRVELQAYGKNIFDDNYITYNTGLLTSQSAFILDQGENPDNFRLIRRDPGAIFGVRASLSY